MHSALVYNLCVGIYTPELLVDEGGKLYD